MKIIKISLIILAILIAITTRFYKLGQAPAGLYIDEAGQGYSAYSILKTGKDEFAKSFPIVFRSFTDFKTPVYIYLIVPLIPIFGLTKFTVRFPSFFFSILTIPILYFLISELTRKLELKSYIKWLGVTSCILLAISPWHILFGRTNFECNVALFFFLTGALFFYKSLTKPKLLIASAFLFAIAIPSYHAQRIVTPLMLLMLFIRHRKILLSQTHKKYLIAGSLIGLLISLPTLSVVLTPGFLARANGLNIISQSRQKPAGFIDNANPLIKPIINSPLFLTTKEFASLYVSYFSPRSMFVLGDYGPRSSFPELATFFIWQAPFYIYGLYLFIKRKNLGELKFFTLAMLLISPIPAALTRDPYSTIRSLQMVIPLTIIISMGILEIYSKIKNRQLQISFWLIFLATLVYSLAKLYSSVIILNEYYRAPSWDYGWEEVANEIKTLDQKLPIIVDNSRNEPYIQLAFFLKEDPIKYQHDNFEVTPSDYYTNMNRKYNKTINQILARPINWEKDLNTKQYLIGDALAISDQQIKEHKLTLIKDINYPDGSIDLRITQTNP